MNQKAYEAMKAKELVKTRKQVEDLAKRFSQALIDKLMEPKNAEKGHWSTVKAGYLYDRFNQESTELDDEIMSSPRYPENIMSEILDCTAFLAFIWDKIQTYRELPYDDANWPELTMSPPRGREPE